MDDELKPLLLQLLARMDTLATKEDVARLQAGQDELRAGQDDLRGKYEELRIGQQELRAGQERVEAGLNEVRQVSGSNYYRLTGRVELLSDQFTKHIARPGHGDDDEAAEPGRKRA